MQIEMETKNTHRVIMLSGPPCVGKSKFVEWMLLQRPGLKIVSSDYFIEQEAIRQGKTYNDIFLSYISTATKLVNEEVQKQFELKRGFIWDQTNLTFEIRQRKLKVFVDDEWQLSGVFFVNADLELLKSRNNRPGKILPEKVLEDMFNKYEIADITMFDEEKIDDFSLFDDIYYVNSKTGNIVAHI